MAKIKSTIISTIAISALTLGFSVPASLAGDEMEFRYNDDELRNPVMAEKLYQRIVKKSEIFCDNPGIRSLSAKQAEKICVQEIINDVITQIDNPYLTNMHTDNGGYVRITKR